jgi:hypothetical protein
MAPSLLTLLVRFPGVMSLQSPPVLDGLERG